MDCSSRGHFKPCQQYSLSRHHKRSHISGIRRRKRTVPELIRDQFMYSVSGRQLQITRMVAWGRTSILNDPDVLYFRNPGDINDNSDWGTVHSIQGLETMPFIWRREQRRPTIEKKGSTFNIRHDRNRSAATTKRRFLSACP